MMKLSCQAFISRVNDVALECRTFERNCLRMSGRCQLILFIRFIRHACTWLFRRLEHHQGFHLNVPILDRAVRYGQRFIANRSEVVRTGTENNLFVLPFAIVQVDFVEEKMGFPILLLIAIFVRSRSRNIDLLKILGLQGICHICRSVVRLLGRFSITQKAERLFFKIAFSKNARRHGDQAKRQRKRGKAELLIHRFSFQLKKVDISIRPK